MSIDATRLVIGLLNIQSSIPKLNELKLHIDRKAIDILALSGTWLSYNADSHSFTITSYNLIRKDKGPRGGCCFYKLTNFNDMQFTDFLEISVIMAMAHSVNVNC